MAPLTAEATVPPRPPESPATGGDGALRPPGDRAAGRRRLRDARRDAARLLDEVRAERRADLRRRAAELTDDRA